MHLTDFVIEWPFFEALPSQAFARNVQCIATIVGLKNAL